MRRTRRKAEAERPPTPDPGLIEASRDDLLLSRQPVGAAKVLTLDAETDAIDERVRGAFVRLVSTCSAEKLAEVQGAVTAAAAKAAELGALAVQACRPRVLRESKPAISSQAWHRVTARESVAEYVRRYPPPAEIVDLASELLDAIMKEGGQ